jgi:hypothetical protein
MFFEFLITGWIPKVEQGFRKVRLSHNNSKHNTNSNLIRGCDRKQESSVDGGVGSDREIIRINVPGKEHSK